MIKNKTFNILVLTTLLSLIFLCSLVNYIVDPFRVFDTANKFNTVRPNQDKNQRLSMIPALKLYKKNIDIIWIGSSKTGWATNEAYESYIAQKAVKNLTINGSSFYENITMAKNALFLHPEIKKIYWGIDFCELKQHTVEKSGALEEVKDKKLKKEEILPLILSLSTFQNSTKTISKSLKSKSIDSTSDYSNYGNENTYNPKVLHKFEHTASTYYEKYKDYKLDEEKFKAIKEFVDFAKEKGVEVEFFTTTMHACERILIYDTDNLDAFYTAKEKLAEIAPYYDFAVIDKYTTEKIKPESKYFRDTVHSNFFLRKKITNQLFFHNEDFGVRVTKTNIKALNKKDKEVFLKYLKNNKDLVNQVKGWEK